MYLVLAVVGDLLMVDVIEEDRIVHWLLPQELSSAMRMKVGSRNQTLSSNSY